MRGKTLVLIAIAAGCGLVASIGISQVMDPNAAAKVETEKIYVALAAIDIGNRLTEANVRIEAWPKDRLPVGAITKFEDLKDKYPRQRFFPDEPILQAKIGDKPGTATDKIPEGYRVIPVKVTSDGTVIELLSPGDRIDVLAFFRKNSDIRATGCKIILRDVRVYSVGAATERIVDETGKSCQAQTVSLLVTPKQAQRVLMAMELGRLQFTLRNQTEAVETGPDGEQEDLDFQEFLSSPSEVASPDHTTTEPQPAAQDSFADWLKNQTAQSANNPPMSVQATAAAPAALWETVVVTEGGIETYEWVDENELPRKGPAKASSGLLVARARATINPFQFIGQKINLDGLLIGGGSLDWEKGFRGRMTLVVAWQSTCATCRAELPLVSGLLEHFQDRNLTAVGVCLDQDTTHASKFLFDRKIGWPTITGPDAEKWVARHGIGQVPTIMLLDREGKLLAIGHHIVDLVPQIELSVPQSATPDGGVGSETSGPPEESGRQSVADR